MNIIYADVDRCGGFSGIMVKKSQGFHSPKIFHLKVITFFLTISQKKAQVPLLASDMFQ